MIILLSSLVSFAQVQKGIVKTRGWLDDEGNLVPGKPLGGVVVKVCNRTEVISDSLGFFSFPLMDSVYSIENVIKKGYVLSDPDLLKRQYTYSPGKNVIIVMETRERLIEERLENYEKINKSQQQIIDNMNAEVHRLKEENKITEEEYNQRIMEIIKIQKENSRMIDEMVERYSKIDYDMLSESDLNITANIINGNLQKADSLVNVKGDLIERAKCLCQLNEANAKEREELDKMTAILEKSEAFAILERDNLANDCFHKAEIYKMRHQDDTAAYYLELRDSLLK